MTGNEQHSNTAVLRPPQGPEFARATNQWCTLWCMKRTNIYLDEEQTAALDRLAAQEGVSRAEVIRQLLDRVLTSSDESLASDLHAIEDSFGVLRDVDVPVRHPGGREEHLARRWGRSS
jgi:Ribbon-helix-helix protein, copG family